MNAGQQIWNGDFSFSVAGSTNAKDLTLGGGNINLGTAAGTSRTITTNGGALLTAPSVISNGTTANSLIKAGNGFLRLNGNNTFTGGVTLNAGVLHIGGNNALGTGTLSINAGGILPRVASRTLPNAVIVNGNFDLGLANSNLQLNFSGPIDLAGGSRTINVVPTTVPPSSSMTGVISNGGLVKSGAGSLALTANNTYSGETSVTDGSLRVQGTGAINSSSGITINGAAAGFSHTSSVALTPVVTLTQGTMESSGTVGTVNVADSSANIVSNGTLGTALNATALNFAGAATINLATTASGAGINAGTLTTSGTDDAILINISKSTPWTNGPNNLISFGSFPSADINDFNFSLINVPLLGARQTMGDLVMNGDNIALNIIGTSIYWTGLESNQWTTTAGVGAKNWKQSSDDAATDFLVADDVVFNDTPGADQTVQIDDFDVSPTTTTFNNTAFNYTLASSSTFGIGTGTLTKSGSGSLTIQTNNFYNGVTNLNAGTLNVNTATALGSGTVNINGGILDNTSGGAITFTYNNAQNWNGDFAFTGSNALDMGTGAVTTAGTGDRTITVTANTLAVGELKTATGQGFIKQGAGTLALTSTGAGAAASVINGTLDVAAGTLQFCRTGAPDANTTGDLTVTNLTGTGTITNGSGYERWLFVTGSGSFSGTFADGSTGKFGFNKPGTSTFTLAGANNYSGVTTVGGGVLTITGTNSAGGTVNIAGGTGNPAVLNLQNSNALGTGTVNATNRNSGIQLQGGIALPSTVSFLLSNDGTSGATVPAAIENISGNNTIHGNISITTGGGGALLRSNSGALTFAGNATIAAGQTSRGLLFDGTSTDANTFSGVLSDLSVTSVASITKGGTGTWTVTGANTYSGATTINAGTLVINGNHSAATGLVTVAANATLAGTGPLGGNVTISADGIHTLALAATPGAQVARTVGGVLTHDAGSVLNLTAAVTPEPGVYTLVTANGGVAGLPTTVTGFTGGTVSISGNSLILTVAGPSAYGDWATAKGLTGANNGANDDPDFDGISNIIEFVLDGNPLASDTSKLPVSTQDATNFYFDFDRRDDSVTEAALTFEYGTTLASWPSSVAIPSNTTPVAGPPVTITDNGGGTHHVKVTVAKSGNPSLFGRLKAVK